MIEKKIVTPIVVYQYDELPDNYKKLIEAAKRATANSYAPYSKFCVGAAVLLDNDEVVVGTNQENSAYPSGLCAERVAMFYANSNFPNIAPRVLAIATYAGGEFLKDPITPCGACRQVLLESEVRYDKNIEILLYGTEAIYKINCVKDLLPLAFDKSSLK